MGSLTGLGLTLALTQGVQGAALTQILNDKYDTLARNGVFHVFDVPEKDATRLRLVSNPRFLFFNSRFL